MSPGIEQGIAIERTEQVEHHRWTPIPPMRGLAPLDGPTRALLYQLRWRKAPPDRRRRWLAVGIVLVLHVLFAWLTWTEMRPLPVERISQARRGALLVRLIPRQPAPAVAEPAPLPPPTVAPAPPPPKPPPVREAPAPQAMTVTLPPPAPATSVPSAPSLRLYDTSGRPLLPSASSAPAPEGPGYVQRMPQGDTKVMRHDSPVTNKATRFEKDWSQGGGSAVDDALKRAVDKSTVSHTFHVAPGVRIHCAVSLAALAGGCGGDPPPAPSSKSGDMRLSLAPTTPLAPGAPAPKVPSVEECIAIYRAGNALPQGCPVDTPTRSVDAELRERAGRQGAQDGG